ncbi:lysophospholipase L1-like esterase [Luteibacter rhizovicinus]|uniref:Lysophospholipase L1-like esterase n=1 Tax=Luteibacter rhizovicinus TaxID=242606 RepID=A0A4R3YV53_9GAMM|nr:SGNH/GDSL hydrolase family protein [Luteibacter rhizovicinus]TCV96501.1 lysophospholipase L1-like esterase [Luteibacter rhizovicinus]
MKRIALLFAALVLAAPVFAKGPDHSRWEPDIRAFEMQDRAQPPVPGAVLFVGSSSIRMWTSLSADFPAFRVVNRGFGGSDLDDSTAFAARIVAPYRPGAIVIYAGDNDLMNGDSPEQVRDDFADFVARVRKDQPQVPIAFISIKPSVSRRALLDKILKSNELIREWASRQKDVSFLDIVPGMVDGQGEPRPELFIADGLHMNSKGYALWTATVEPWLEQHAKSAEIKRMPKTTGR